MERGGGEDAGSRLFLQSVITGSEGGGLVSWIRTGVRPSFQHEQKGRRKRGNPINEGGGEKEAMGTV